jgi:hypothetical protein
MRIARIVLVAVGALSILLGAWVLFDTVKPKSIWGLLTWLIAAVILHDGIVSPIVVGISVGMRRVGRTIPAAVLAIVQAGVLVGCVFTLVVVPEIIRKAKIPKNYTVLPFDYGTRLALLWAAVAVVTAVAVLVYLRVRSRRARVFAPAAA